jgi:hypothetical protein
MILLTCCQSDSLTCWEILTRILTVFAAIVAIGYFMRPRLYFCAYKEPHDANLNNSNQGDTSGISSLNSNTIDEPVKKRIKRLIGQLSDYIEHIEEDPFGEENWDESSSIETAKEPLNPQEEKEALEIFKRSYGIVIGRYDSTIGSGVTIDQRPNEDDGRYCIKIENMNFFCNTIKEIRCEMAIAKDSTFSIIKTIKLSKPETLFLRSRRSSQVFNYVFWAKSSNVHDDYRFVRIRLLATNFLGIKKHYERYFVLDELTQNTNRKTQCQCWHKINTNKLTFSFVKTGVRCLIGAKFEKLFDSRT